MSKLTNLQQELPLLFHELGREERQFAILGEENTSVDCGDGTFWMKPSGGGLATLAEAAVSQAQNELI